MSDAISFVAGRECGPCYSCCQWTFVDQPDIRKSSGVLCRHASDSAGCRIYATRPGICRGWFCGWRQSALFEDALRPDRSGVLVIMDGRHAVPAPYDSDDAVCFVLFWPVEMVLTPAFVTVVARLLAQSVPVIISLPGPVGFAGKETFLNDVAATADAIDDPDRLALLLRQIAEHLDGLGECKPDRFVHAGPDFGL